MNRASAAGWTLVEVLLVAVVTAVLLASSLPKFQHTAERLRTERAAFELAQLARYAHARAAAGGVDIQLNWSDRDRRASLSTVSAEGALTLLDDPAARTRPLPESLTLSVAANGQLASCACARFFADGTSDGAVLSVTGERQSLRVTIDAATSQVDVSTGPAPAHEQP